MQILEDLYVIEDLFRVGNAESPKLDRVRERDIAILRSEYAGLRHYLIQPAYPMELQHYQEELRRFALQFEKVAKEGMEKGE
jgi:hypothetical protein